MVLLMEEILHQWIGSCSSYFQGFIHSRSFQVVRDFFYQQYGVNTTGQIVTISAEVTLNGSLVGNPPKIS